ncbi:MAG: ribonuclease activity regulator RraA [Candidatus Limnocylindria bacterium]
MADQPSLSATTVAALQGVSTATLTAQLLRRGIRTTFLAGVRPLRPDLRMVGRAVTLRYVPARDDVGTGATFDNRTNAQRIAVESVGLGDVLVIDARGDTRAAALGNILATRILRLGAAGIVTDGALRDTPGFARIELPTYAAGANAALSSTIHHPVDMNVPIGCAGVLVMPGDILVGDAEGVVVIPASMAEEVAADASEQERLETYVLQRVDEGAALHGTYPPSDETIATFREAR